MLYARQYSRFIEIKNNFGRKKLHGMNQGSNFLGDSFSNRENVRAPIKFRRKIKFQYLKRLFSSRADSSIFTPIAPESLDPSNITS